MSSVSPLNSQPESVPTENASVESPFESRALRTIQFVGFWIAVIAPLAYPPLLFTGLDTQTLFLLLGVVAVNVLGLLLGRGYADDA